MGGRNGRVHPRKLGPPTALVTRGRVFEYRMSIQTIDPENARRLAERLRARADVLEFRISPTGD